MEKMVRIAKIHEEFSNNITLFIPNFLFIYFFLFNKIKIYDRILLLRVYLLNCVIYFNYSLKKC